jgi:hypothetical protein
VNSADVTHTCCGTTCMFEHREDLPCWGNIKCVDYIELDDGDEIRHAVCDGHDEMWPSCDDKKYVKRPTIDKEV